MADDAFDAALAEYITTAGLDEAGVNLTALRSFILRVTVPKAHIAEKLTAMRDELANIEHDRWGHWQRYMHEQCRPDTGETGALVIPAELVTQWERQANTPFSNLSSKEKNSDREQVDRYLPLLIERLKT